MPLYTFRCSSCGSSEDVVRPLEQRRASFICACGGTKQRAVERFTSETFEPYYDEGLGCDVHSRMERRAIMRMLGVVEAGDRVHGGRNVDEGNPNLMGKRPLRGVRKKVPTRDTVVETVDKEGRVVSRGMFSELPESK